jgi:hypothetical protein
LNKVYRGKSVWQDKRMLLPEQAGLEFPGKSQLKEVQLLEKAGNFFRPSQAVFWRKQPFHANFALFIPAQKKT